MRLPRRRRLEKKTDYKARFGLLKSGKPRLIIRKTNRYVIAQIVETDIAQDRIIIGATSKSLLENGWPKEKTGSLKSLTAAYLTGLLIGKLAVKKGIKNAILDTGMNRNVHKSRIYSVLKGAVDAGLNIPHDSKSTITEQDLEKNKTLAPIMKKVREKIA